MMHIKNLVVAVRANNSFLADQDSKVYMPFGTEYSLYFKNKDSRRVIVGPLTIDGTDVLHGKRVIIDGGSTWDLEGSGSAFDSDRDSNYRFKFIEKIKEIVEHRGNTPEDGLISVSFQYEESKPQAVHIRRPSWQTSHMWDSSSPLYGSIGGSATPASFSTSVATTQNDGGSRPRSMTAKSAGITAEGSNFDKSYEQATTGILNQDIHTLTFGIYGDTGDNQPVLTVITPKTKIRCTLCDTKQSFKNKFCSTCGNNLH